MSHDVFISYSSKNKNVADAIVSDFEQNGIRCWYAPRDIRPGEEWVTAITKALEISKALVLIYTEDSNCSRQVMNEIAVAFNAGITIVPFKLSDEQMSSELEYYLTRVHWLDALSKPLKKNITALREYIDVIISTPNGSAPIRQKSADEIAAEKLAAAEALRKKKIKIITCACIGIIIAAIMIVVGFIKYDEHVRNQAYADAIVEFWDLSAPDDYALYQGFEYYAEYIPGANYYLGRMYERSGDYESAAEYYGKGQAQDSMLCLLGIGNLYLNGNVYEQDAVKAKEYFDCSLFEGCVEANYYEAYMWAHGLIPGEMANLPQAKEYADKALESSDREIVALTYLLLGDMCRMGYGGAGMMREDALDYYDDASGHCAFYEKECDDRIGEYYMEEEEYELALDWYEKAAKLGNRHSYKMIGDMYFDGIGVDMDESAALKYYLKAGGFNELDGEPWFDRDEAGYDEERLFNRLGLIYYYEYRYKEAAYFFTLAADEFDSVNGMGNAGMAYENLMDWENALKWYGAAIDAGHDDSDNFRRHIRIMVDDGLVGEGEAARWL